MCPFKRWKLKCISQSHCCHHNSPNDDHHHLPTPDFIKSLPFGTTKNRSLKRCLLVSVFWKIFYFQACCDRFSSSPTFSSANRHCMQPHIAGEEEEVVNALKKKERANEWMSEKRINVFSHFYKVCRDVATQIATTKIAFTCNAHWMHLYIFYMVMLWCSFISGKAVEWDSIHSISKSTIQMQHNRQLNR